MKQDEMIEFYDIYAKSEYADKMSFIVWYQIFKEESKAS